MSMKTCKTCKDMHVSIHVETYYLLTKMKTNKKHVNSQYILNKNRLSAKTTNSSDLVV